MATPDWSKIPFEKMPKWKQEELLGEKKRESGTLGKLIEEQEKNPFTCEVCEKVCKSKAGLKAHLRSHNKTDGTTKP